MLVVPPGYRLGMESLVLDTGTADAIRSVASGLDCLFAAGVDPVDPGDALVVVRELEVLQRRLRALQVDALDRIQQRGLHRHDGHASAKVLVRHAGRLSNPEAMRRAAAATMLRDLPLVRAGFRAGMIGDCQIAAIARAYGNRRVRQRLIGRDEELARLAAHDPYDVFAGRLADWVRLMDEDGTTDETQRSHENRDFKHVQVGLGGPWLTTIHHGSLQGAEVDNVFHHYLTAEIHADWTEAKAVHGPDVNETQLRRTDAQRRYDAFAAMVAAAARNTPNSESSDGGAITRIATDIVIGAELFERTVARMTGQPVEPLDLPIVPDVPWGYRCSTLDGHLIDPVEAVDATLMGDVRRVVMGADSVVTDMGRKSRIYRDAAALAVRLGRPTCYWPGCWAPVTRCQLDHLKPWAHGGHTSPSNGAPACAKHNRTRQRGYPAHRDQHGTIHIHHPDGTEIT